MSPTLNRMQPQPDSPQPEGKKPLAKLSFLTKLAYGAGDLGSAMTANLLIFYLSPFLTDVAGLRPGLAAWTQLIGKIWDAVNDPIVGVLSDRTTSAEGRRYPWMIWGAIPFGLFFFLQWLVPRIGQDESFNQIWLFIFYTVLSILFNSFFTVVNLPYTALTPELTQDYNERTSLNSFRFAFSIGGSILSVVLFGAIATWLPHKQTHYLVSGLVCAVLSVIPIYLCVWGTRDRARAVAASQPESSNPVVIPLLEQLRIVFGNRPFLYVVGIYLCSWLALQLTATIIPYFVASWMRITGPEVTTFVILAVQGTAMAMLFVWSAISQKVGKKKVYFMGMGLWIIAQIGLFLLQPGQIAGMYALGVIAGIGVSTAYLVPWSMLPDVIELDELNTGQRREGIFYSFMVFLQKVGLGLAIALVLQFLEWTGYVRPIGSEIPMQPEAVLWVIRLSIGPFPTLCLILGLVLAHFYPISQEVHTEILLKLQERKHSQNPTSFKTEDDP